MRRPGESALMSEQIPNKFHPFSNRFRGRTLVHITPIFMIGPAIYLLFEFQGEAGSYMLIWAIGWAAFMWFWSTRFAWRTWWDNRTHGRYASDELTDSDFHERRVRLAAAHPYAVLWQSFFVMALMFWASQNPEFLSLHFGVWFYLGVLVIWCLVSFFTRWLARSELRDFDTIHHFNAKQGRFVSAAGLEERDS